MPEVAGYRGERREGLLIAVGIASALVLLLWVGGTVAGARTENGVANAAYALLVTAIAGGVGGWTSAPAAARTRTRLGWAGVVLLLSITAVLIGAVVIGISMGVVQAFADQVDLLYAVPYAIAVGLAYAFIGVLVIGPFALPFTAIAALLWAFVIARRQKRRTVP